MGSQIDCDLGQASRLTSLCLSLLICKMGVIKLSRLFWGLHESIHVKHLDHHSLAHSNHVTTVCCDYHSPLEIKRRALLSFRDSIKGSELSVSPQSDEWIKCVLFLLPLNAQTNRLDSNFLREIIWGLNYVLGTFFFLFFPQVLALWVVYMK